MTTDPRRDAVDRRRADLRQGLVGPHIHAYTNNAKFHALVETHVNILVETMDALAAQAKVDDRAFQEAYQEALLRGPSVVELPLDED